jgi:methylglutaconyl-CoA hydratase
MASTILRQVDERGVATITLNRPERHNAFDDALIAALHEALHDTTVRALVLTGAGPSFSAGADLDWMRRVARYTRQDNEADAEALADMMQALADFPKPTIAMVQGAAYGGGVGLVACCDIAIASEQAVFCLSEVKLGLIPAVISPYVIDAIGARQARRYFQTAEIITAPIAQKLGLVHEVVPHEKLATTQHAILHALLKGAPRAQAEVKALVRFCGTETDPQALRRHTIQAIAARRTSDEGQNGIEAFLGKTRPSWWPDV